MCPTHDSNPPSPFSFNLVDRLHGLAESGEQVQTLAEQLAGDIYGDRVTEQEALFAAKRLEGVARVLAASAAKLVEGMPDAE